MTTYRQNSIPPRVLFGQVDIEGVTNFFPCARIIELSEHLVIVLSTPTMTDTPIARVYTENSKKSQMIIQLFSILNPIENDEKLVDAMIIVKETDFLGNKLPESACLNTLQDTLSNIVNSHLLSLRSYVKVKHFSLLRLKCWIYTLACDISECLSDSLNIVHEDKYKAEDIIKIQNLQSSLKANFYKNGYTLDDMAEMIGMGTSKFKTIFRDVVGVSPHQYILTLRLNYAKKLLKNQDLTISEVAYKVGFNHSSELTRLFKKKEGMIPKEVANHNKKRYMSIPTATYPIP